MVVIIVHGGAGNISEESFPAYLNGVILSAKRGYEKLKNNRPALDATVEAVCSLEDDSTFNAGLGSSLTIKNTVEADAFVMEGSEMKVGAVTCVKKFKNPVKVARLVMEKSDHCILGGEGAHQFGELNGVKLVDNNELVHQSALNRLIKYKTFLNTINLGMKNSGETNHHFENQLLKENDLNKATKLEDHDTVGAVAMDFLGNLACSTSTGGLTAKAIGRIGDSPLAGSGGWAQNDICAISTTGHGEKILRVVLAKHIASELDKLYKENSKEEESKRMSNKEIINKGADNGLNFMKERVNGYGGVICIDKNGEFSARFNTQNMPWAAIDGKKLYFGIKTGQIEERELDEIDSLIIE